ncbi:sensor histidine kinase [Streptomyces paludis]|uniref:histidine kinase n=1 Tax=Streptomyces paludis TaxID=2282738 RepID=A0A345HXI5_9ACTN|nr:ATP-binding protein [Streptomyces paludis]AXG81409.1 ATP-binding protein [Streptomyces paludis]
MSHLRAPVARPERREGGRHGRPGSRSLSSLVKTEPTAPPDTRIRPQLMRTAVLPAIIAALSGATAVVVVLRTTAAEPTAEIWTALFGTALLALAAVAAAALGAERTAKSLLGRCEALRRSNARGQAELRAVLELLRRGEPVAARRPPPPGAEPGAGEEDEFDLLARELTRSQAVAVGAVVQASRLSSSVGNEQKVEVFVNLARRLQSLVHREIQLLDELENQVEDPELLKGIFHVDHLATRIRRHAENLAVLGGAVSRRQWSRPVAMTEVLRSAIAEVEQYPRIKLVPPIDGTLRGHAVADVIHLLAELVENATLFSSPHTQVLLRAQHVTAGLAIEVEDRGLGMPADEQKRMNSLLTDPDQVNVAHLLQDGRIGLFVVSALARRHGIAVRLQSNIYGGVQAVLVLPQSLLGSDRTEQGDQGVRGAQAVPGARYPVAPAVPPATPPTTAPPATPPTAPPVPPVPPRRSPAPAPPQPQSSPQPQPQPPRRPVPGEPAGDGTIESAGSRPRLPRRRGQEHLVPQLRDAPVPPPAGETALHDPGLMAAFQRGIGLAESQPAPRADPRADRAAPRHERPADPLPGPRGRDTTPTTKE